MHAFDGNAKAAKLGCDQGYYFSIPASVARADGNVQKEKLIKAVPLDRLLLETDSPTLCKLWLYPRLLVHCQRTLNGNFVQISVSFPFSS